MNETSEITKKDSEYALIEKPDEKWVERMDRIRNSFMSDKQLLYLNQRDFDYREQLRLSYSIFADPNILQQKQVKTVCELLKISDTKARALKKAHLYLWGYADRQNKRFEKNFVAQQFLEMYFEAKEDGELEQAAEFLDKYAKLKGHYNDVETDEPRALPKLMRSTQNTEIIEDAEHEILE